MSEPSEVATPTLDARTERAARQFATFLDVTLRRLSSLTFSVATVAALIGLATYVTGFWAFDGSTEAAWIVIGGVVCLIPAVAGIAAFIFVRITIRPIPRVLADVRALLGQSKQAFAVVIDHDSGQPVTTTARSLTKLSGTIRAAPGKYPALMAAVRAGMKVPWLIVVTVLSALVIGAFGSLLALIALLG